MPIANELLRAHESSIEKFPLHLRVCNDCGLGQVADVVTPERIFRDYRYLSSMSTTFLEHALKFVEQKIEENIFEQRDWVLEIASNDGYLLKNFLPYGISVIGVEPAENVAELSRSLGIETITEFFSSNLAEELLRRYGFPKLIIANNVMAHVPDLVDFIKGLSILCGSETQISIENPSLTNILIKKQFDTIYHEHYSYLSAFAVDKISRLNGLLLYHVESLTIHGGSNRYWLKKLTQDQTVEVSVEKEIDLEVESGLFNSNEWKDYSFQVKEILSNFLNWLEFPGDSVRRVYGYGAAAKASTILNSIEVKEGLITAIADVSREKQSRFMPPHGIRIISPNILFSEKPTDIIIFPWNIKTEIAHYLRANLDPDVRLWCVVPFMHEVK